MRNITDVGHLLENESEDKIAKRAKIEQLEPMEIVQKYTTDFHDVLNKFNNLPPSIEPTATGHLIEQIEFIQKLLEKGLAYEVNGSVYFDILKYNESETYGELSKRDIEDLISSTRELDGQSEKKTPQDFALWKKANPEHIMKWPSPWGKGFPGWHLECTVMSTKYLGNQFDIHGGGMDLKFPHHECEIAQAKAANGKSPVNYWMHANLLTLNGKKMSKSTGNTILPEELFSGNNTFFEKAFEPMVVRFFMLQAHYRSNLDLSNEAMLASEKGYNRLMAALKTSSSLPTEEITTINLEEWIKNCHSAMNDDFNTPILISFLFDMVKMINSIKEGPEKITVSDLELLNKTFTTFIVDVLGLGEEKNQNNTSSSQKLDKAMDLIIKLREQARVDKKWDLSDEIRDTLAKEGIKINDGKSDTTYTIVD